MKKLILLSVMLVVGCILRYEDCEGEYLGSAEEDDCGVCDDIPENDCVRDCAGTWGGTAVEDECSVCEGIGLQEGDTLIVSRCYNKSDLEFVNDLSSEFWEEDMPDGDVTTLSTIYGDSSFYISQHIVSWSYNNHRITFIQLKNRGLDGNIPEAIGDLTELKQLWLSYNQLHGEIPAGFNNLTKLERLSLHDNQFIGSIENLVHLTSIEWMSLSYNQFSGVIPENIGNLTNLRVLLLHNNQLSGTIPESICNLENLNWASEYVSSQDSTSYISNNKLCPPYPSCIEDFVGTQDTSECEYCIENPDDPDCN